MALDEKDLYTQAGEMARYYLTWREKILGGYVVIIAGLAIVAVQKINIAHFESVMSFLGALVSVVFWLLDIRNRNLFQTCIEAGAELEQSAGLKGALLALENIPEGPRSPTHGRIIDAVFAIVTGFLFFLAVFLWFNPLGNSDDTRPASGYQKLE